MDVEKARSSPAPKSRGPLRSMATEAQRPTVYTCLRGVSAFHFYPFLSPLRQLPLLCGALLSPPPVSSRCRRPYKWCGHAAAAMFAWILRGCRDESSASDQLKQVGLSPPKICFSPSISNEPQQEKEAFPPFCHSRVLG